MEYKVNERYFERVLEIMNETEDMGKDEAQIMRYIATHIGTSIEEGMRFSLSGNLSDIEKGAGDAGVVLDMTYETIGNIIPAIVALAFSLKRGGQNNQKISEQIMKYLATYLTLMAVNNHRARIQVNKRGGKRGEKAPDLWINQYYLRINNKRDSDFLPAAIMGIVQTPGNIEDGLAFDFNPLIESYKRITGVDLTEYGFGSLLVDFDKEEYVTRKKRLPAENDKKTEDDVPASEKKSVELKLGTEAAMEILQLSQMSQEEMEKYNSNHAGDPVATVKGVLGLYAGELIIASDEAGAPLDLSYESLNNISAAMAMLYTKQHNWGYEDQRNKVVTCKSLAAYINLMIINLFDDCSIDVESFDYKGESPDLWVDQIRLRLGDEDDSDMLPYIWEGANRVPLQLDNGFMIDITPLVNGYMKLTGENLAEEGLSNMIITYGPPSDEIKEFLQSVSNRQS